jgi:hypothetical protein
MFAITLLVGVTLGLLHLSANAPLSEAIPAGKNSVASTPSASSSTIALQNFGIFHGDGYAINIPQGYTYLKAPDGHDTWHSNNDDILAVQWDIDTPDSQLNKLEQANTTDLTPSQVAAEQLTISHPVIKGTSTATMLMYPLEPGTYGIYLFVHGQNGRIYLVYAIAHSLQAKSALRAHPRISES